MKKQNQKKQYKQVDHTRTYSLQARGKPISISIQMILLEQSHATVVLEKDGGPAEKEIHVVMQYFVHSKPERDAELKLTLQLLCDHPDITRIHMLNECIYDAAASSSLMAHPKIHQVDIGARLKFKDVFQYLREQNIQGYHVIINSDICFDGTLSNLRLSDLHCSKKMMAQLRYDVTDTANLLSSSTTADLSLLSKQSELFCGSLYGGPVGPRCDSQDTWIFHSRQAIPQRFEKLFNFHFGKPGCDNKMIYLMRMLGYEVVNDPEFVKTFHIHLSQERNYTAKDRVPAPYGLLSPHGHDFAAANHVDVGGRSCMDVGFRDNRVLYDYVTRKLAANEGFVIPRIAGHENNYAAFGRIIRDQCGGKVPDGLADYFKQTLPVMKNNAGIRISSTASIVDYSTLYLGAFENCQLFAGWESYGNVIRHIQQSHDMITQWYLSSGQRTMFWAFAFDIFHYVYDMPWTWALRGKRVLIVSPFEESFREKVPIRSQLYDGVDLFPDCEFLFIRPPQTQGSEPSQEFSVELDGFLQRLDTLRGQYDVALVSCGGYGNLVCNAIYESGHSAIYVGGVLQMYFGVLGGRWLRERPDVVRLFLNSHWSRPKASERPKDCERVEGSSYW